MDRITDLYIAEKPSLAAAIASVLPGAGTAVKTRTHITVGTTVLTWCVGHLLEQCAPEDYDPRYQKWNSADLPILPSQWRVKPRDGAAAQLAAIKKLLPHAQRVVHAGDPDSEGQLIVDEVLQYLGNTKPVARILVNDYNEAKLREAIAAIAPNTKPHFVGWRRWAECRSRLDWLIGMNMSRAYTLRAAASGFDVLLTVGRVQTPTLAIVVGRDEAIERFKPVPYFALVATATTPAGQSFNATWKPREGQAGLDADGRLLDGAIATALVNRLTAAPVRVAGFAAAAKTQAAPLPFSLKTLQMAANDAFGYTAAKTLEAAQALYETHKLTTYPRSDCAYLSKAQHAESPARLAAIAANLPLLANAVVGADAALMSAAFNDAKVTAHHAIVPTSKRGDAAALSDVERNVYLLICRAYVAQFYPAHAYEQTKITLDVGGETFVATGRRTLKPGWRAVFDLPEQEDAEHSDDERQTLPRMAEGDALTNRGVQARGKQTTPPARFTEKTLLAAMGEAHKYVANPVAKARLKEGQGIGTPATSASIIEELKRRDYLVTSGKQLISTPKARSLVHALPAVSTDPGFTGLTEQSLDEVAAGQLSADVFMQKTAQLVTKLVDTAKTATMTFPVHRCPACNEGTLRRRKGAAGAFWGCSRYESGCKATYEDKKGAPHFGPKSKPKSKRGGGAGKKAGAAKGRGTRTIARRAGAGAGVER